MEQFPSMKAKRLLEPWNANRSAIGLRAKLARIAVWKRRTDHR